MNDLLEPRDVEQRLRRSLHSRSERMAEGDGADWDPTEITHTLAPFAAEAAEGWSTARRTLVAAAATMTVGGLAAAALLGGSGSPSADGDAVVRSPDGSGQTPAGVVERCAPWTETIVPDTDLPATTAPGAPSTVPQGATTTAPSNATTTTGFDAPTTTTRGDLPAQQHISMQVDTTPADPSWAHQISITKRGPEAYEPDAGDEVLDINGRTAWYRMMEGSNDEMGAITLDYDGELLVVTAMQVPKADVIAVAESLERQADGTWEYLVLPEYESHCPAPQ